MGFSDHIFLCVVRKRVACGFRSGSTQVCDCFSYFCPQRNEHGHGNVHVTLWQLPVPFILAVTIKALCQLFLPDLAGEQGLGLSGYLHVVTNICKVFTLLSLLLCFIASVIMNSQNICLRMTLHFSNFWVTQTVNCCGSMEKDPFLKGIA